MTQTPARMLESERANEHRADLFGRMSSRFPGFAPDSGFEANFFVARAFTMFNLPSLGSNSRGTSLFVFYCRF
jgi:hypothetical protein